MDWRFISQGFIDHSSSFNQNFLQEGCSGAVGGIFGGEPFIEG